MKYPKKKLSIFVQFGDCDCRQVNIHRGRKWLYWFIEPADQPIKTELGIIPQILLDKNIEEKLTNFHQSLVESK